MLVEQPHHELGPLPHPIDRGPTQGGVQSGPVVPTPCAAVEEEPGVAQLLHRRTRQHVDVVIAPVTALAGDAVGLISRIVRPARGIVGLGGKVVGISGALTSTKHGDESSSRGLSVPHRRRASAPGRPRH